MPARKTPGQYPRWKTPRAGGRRLRRRPPGPPWRASPQNATARTRGDRKDAVRKDPDNTPAEKPLAAVDRPKRPAPRPRRRCQPRRTSLPGKRAIARTTAEDIRKIPPRENPRLRAKSPGKNPARPRRGAGDQQERSPRGEAHKSRRQPKSSWPGEFGTDPVIPQAGAPREYTPATGLLHSPKFDHERSLSQPAQTLRQKNIMQIIRRFLIGRCASDNLPHYVPLAPSRAG